MSNNILSNHAEHLIHDEIVVEVPAENVEAVEAAKAELKELMESKLPMPHAPIPVDLEVVEKWDDEEKK